MRQPSLRSKRIRLTLVAALAACSSLVLTAPALAQSAYPLPERPVLGNPIVTMGSASYRLLPNSTGSYGDGRLSANGVINPQGRPGQWGFEFSRFSDFREIGTCGSRDGIHNGDIEGDYNDHPVSASSTGSVSSQTMKPECSLSPRVMAIQNTRTLYVRVRYIALSVGGDDGCAGTPPGAVQDPSIRPGQRCYSGTVSVPIPDSEVFGPGAGGGGGSNDPGAGDGGGSSDGQLITALRGSLAPMGSAAKIGSILKKGFSAASFNAPSAGSAGVTWTLPASGAKKVVVAKGTRNVSRAGKTKIKVKLTKRGKALLRRAKRARKRLKLKATGSFKPSGGSKVSTSRTITLKN